MKLILILLFVVTPLRVVVASNSEADNIPSSKKHNTTSTDFQIIKAPKNTYSDLLFYYFQIKHPSSLEYTFPQIVPQQQTSLDK
jgi:hypothetical protein